MQIQTLGVKIDALNEGEALDKVLEFMNEGKDHLVFTPNPEMMVEAHKDSILREILNKSNLNICDAKGLHMLCKFHMKREGIEGWQYFKRIPGVDFMLDICELAARHHYSIYLLGSGDEEVLMRAIKNLQEKFPGLDIVGYHPGPKLDSYPNKKLKYRSHDNENVIIDIVQTSPDILFVGFGQGKQEKWIDENIKKLPGVRIAMGVGGSIDMIAGKLKRAPKLLRKLGFEWLWRLIQEPSRIGRIWTAVVVFPILFFTHLNKKADKHIHAHE